MTITQFVGVALFVAFSSVGSVQAQALREPSTPDEVQRARRALEERGVRGAAALYGKYVQEEPVAPQGVAANVRVLAAQSDVVVAGRVLTAVSTVTADGKGICTEYRVAIERLFKGPNGLVKGTILDVSLPGGDVTFSDGSSAKGVTRDLRQMESDKTYLLFLTQTREGAPEAVAAAIGPFGRYRLTMGGQGAYELNTPSANGAVMPLGNSETPVAYELYTLKTSEAALTRVQQAVDSLQAGDRDKKGR